MMEINLLLMWVDTNAHRYKTNAFLCVALRRDASTYNMHGRVVTERNAWKTHPCEADVCGIIFKFPESSFAFSTFRHEQNAQFHHHFTFSIYGLPVVKLTSLQLCWWEYSGAFCIAFIYWISAQLPNHRRLFFDQSLTKVGNEGKRR